MRRRIPREVEGATQVDFAIHAPGLGMQRGERACLGAVGPYLKVLRASHTEQLHDGLVLAGATPILHLVLAHE